MEVRQRVSLVLKMFFVTNMLPNLVLTAKEYCKHSRFDPLRRGGVIPAHKKLAIPYTSEIVNCFIVFNPLQPTVAFLYPLKASENLKVF